MTREDIQSKELGNLQEEKDDVRPAGVNPMTLFHVGASVNFVTALDTYQLPVGKIQPTKEQTREQQKVHSYHHLHLQPLHLLRQKRNCSL